MTRSPVLAQLQTLGAGAVGPALGAVAAVGALLGVAGAHVEDLAGVVVTGQLAALDVVAGAVVGALGVDTRVLTRPVPIVAPALVTVHTLLAVLTQLPAPGTLAHEGAGLVDAVLVAATVVLQTLVNVLALALSAQLKALVTGLGLRPLCRLLPVL